MTKNFKKPEVLIVTGVSGSGKSTALKAFEDLGYFCIDNLPVTLLLPLVKVKEREGAEKLALVMDIRGGEFLERYQEEFRKVKEEGYYLEILFLTASLEVLLYRYSQTRRVHPLGRDIPLREALSKEVSLLEPLREMATTVIDTSQFNPYQLRAQIISRYGVREDLSFPVVHVLSFGFKYGIPAEAHFVFDLRFLPNPYFVPDLKPLSGLDKEVRSFVIESDEGSRFVRDVVSFLEFVFPYCEREGRGYIVVAFGCTGGRHRSVAVAEEVAERFRRSGKRVLVSHRDLEKDSLKESK